MKKKNSIIFFGTPDFAVKSLDAIYSNFNIQSVVTTPDRKSGRGQKLNESDVKKYAQKQNLNILQPDNLKDEGFINEVKKLDPDLIIVVAFRKIPKEIFSIPKYGTINLHASLLPNYRGAAPINWCLINNETKTGVTTFFINEKIDQGDILLQEELIISNEDDFGLLYNKLSKVGAKLLVKTIKKVFSNNLNPSKQYIDTEIKLAPKLNSENTRIDWNKPVNNIIGQVKGLSPKPGAWTKIRNGKDVIRMKILKAKGKEIESLQDKITGKIVIENGELHIYSTYGVINCLIIQMENKRQMSAKELINGMKFDEKSHVY
ncbi:MAG: methionyl-tRNA formyltransferase [Flavobacteriales bacterium]|jgi:methionyl-tRNA formyltransferase|nr:methionyl-tRNA formyltransferase [Flavobacteriales bacterium]MBL6877106.1 methionyl-tRNA formyltransferase [Flavobacteriales bacterium]